MHTQILYNKAYVLDHMGFRTEAMDELVTARGIAADTSELRHRIITSALESMRVRGLAVMECRPGICLQSRLKLFDVDFGIKIPKYEIKIQKGKFCTLSMC